jgi:hypothetical protein
MAFQTQTGFQNAATFSQSTDYTPTQSTLGFWVTTAGNIKVDMVGTGTAVTFAGVPVGFFPCQANKIYSTSNGTTAVIGLMIW